MSRPDLHVAPEVAAAFPGTEVGTVWLEGVDNSGPAPGLDGARSRAVERLRERFEGADLATAAPFAAWRAAYRSFGTDPTRRRPAVEALARRALAGRPPPPISPIVDAYLIASLERLVPFGGYDANRVTGQVSLRRSPGGEPFVALGETESSHTEPGEVVYADDARVLTRHWNHRDCHAARITPTTTRALLVCEVLPDTGANARAACERVAELVLDACGGDAEIRVVSASRRRPPN